ncbi:MAG: S1/P1 nuclease [Pyrinomonadaceae bacterium]|nr:S1/P1 nuclease [Pyrinomonadaceae bacterium]
MHNLGKKLASLFLLACLVCMPASAFAWGTHGHRIVALVAANYLSAVAQDEVTRLLRDEELVDISTWADDIRPNRPETAPWHFVDIPLADNNFNPATECQNDDCVIAQLEKFRKVINDANAARRERREALQFIVHFMGDIHQPLHDADNNDRGGNNFKVTFFGRPTNLHHVWDSDMIANSGLNDSDYAAALVEEFSGLGTSGQQAMIVGSPLQWALEAHVLARDNAYRVASNRRIGKSYYDRNILIVDGQLLRGGVRLAKFLNDNLVRGNR